MKIRVYILNRKINTEIYQRIGSRNDWKLLFLRDFSLNDSADDLTLLGLINNNALT